MLDEMFEEQRKNLVNNMVRNGAIQRREVRKAFLGVKRELFFGEGRKQYSYVDSAFPIGFGQTISQPTTIAVMLELLEVGRGMKVLEVGAGCGYVLALLAKLVGPRGRVFGIDIVAELASISIENLKKAGIKGISVKYGDGAKGLPEKAPFDRIIISAACSEVPKPLVEQLAKKGRLVAPVGSGHAQQMIVISKDEEGRVREEFPYNGYFVFVPLREP